MLLFRSFHEDFPPDQSHLIKELRQFPARTSLMEFGDLLIQFFRNYHESTPPSEDDQTLIEDLEHKLGISYFRKKLRPPKDLLRTIRHMLYGHRTIVGDRTDKEITLDHHARVQILLAKRLSIHRVPREIREATLKRPTKELEGLLILPIERLKSELVADSADHSHPQGKSRHRESRKRFALLERPARHVLRFGLIRRAVGPTLEIDEKIARRFLEDDSLKLESLERFLELIFDLDPDSDEVQKILSLASEASKDDPET